MRNVTALLAAVLVLGCGGGGASTQPDDDEVDFSPEDDALFGDGPPQAGPLEEEPAETEGEGGPVGPTRVTVEVKLGTEEYEGEVQVQNASGATVAQGRGGQTFTLQAGEYTVVARATNEDHIIGAPVETTEPLTLAGEEEKTVRVSIPASQVRLDVRRNGRPLRAPQVTLFREGGDEPVARFVAGDRHITIVPGRYEADVRTGNQEIRVRGLTFMEGAQQNIPVNVTSQ
jgi:hypothetical protein